MHILIMHIYCSFTSLLLLLLLFIIILNPLSTGAVCLRWAFISERSFYGVF